MITDKVLLKTIQEMQPVTVMALTKALKSDPISVRVRVQRLKSEGLVEVANRTRRASVTECTYKLAPQPERAIPFEGYMSAVEAASFRKSVANTPWAGMASLV